MGAVKRSRLNFIASPFFQALVPVLLIMFFMYQGYVYGRMTNEIKNDKDVANQLSDTMASMGMYIVLAFTAGQFVAYFNHTNLGKAIAVSGAEFLDSIGFEGIGLIIAFIFVAAAINLFIGSSSAKWAIMAPVFVPIMMQLGYSPELTTLAYRIADSTTNIISPLMSLLCHCHCFCAKIRSEYRHRNTHSDDASLLDRFSLVIWVIMLLIWMLTGAPIGPDAGFFYNGVGSDLSERTVKQRFVLFL